MLWPSAALLHNSLPCHVSLHSSLQAPKFSHKCRYANIRSEFSEACGSINILYICSHVSVVVLYIYRFLLLCYPSSSYEGPVHTMSRLTVNSRTVHRYGKYALPICVIRTNKMHFFSPNLAASQRRCMINTICCIYSNCRLMMNSQSIRNT